MAKVKTPIESRIRQRLKETGMTVTDLAKELGVSRVALYYLFRGNFSREMLSRIAEVLDIPGHVLIAPETGKADLRQDRMVEAYRRASPTVQRSVDVLLCLEEVNRVKKPVVVVVDDIADNVQLLKRTLRKDFEVIEFTDPRDALKAMQESPFDAVISDQRMPEMTGTELFKKVDEIGKPVARLIVSAYTDNRAMMDAINETHVDAFIVKPFEPEALRAKLAQLLRRESARDSGGSGIR